MKRCTVVYALPERQWTWSVDLAPEGTVSDALRLARAQSVAEPVPVPWETADVGVFGEICGRDAPVREGDRVEIYRPLRSDPKESRRARAAARRAAAAGPASSRPPMPAPKKAR